MSRNWPQFASGVRRSVSGSAAVSELLFAVLSGDVLLIHRIRLENIYRDYYSQLVELLKKAQELVVTFQGRSDLRQLAENHAWIADLPTDDVSIRRAYNNWRNSTGQRTAHVA